MSGKKVLMAASAAKSSSGGTSRRSSLGGRASAPGSNPGPSGSAPSRRLSTGAESSTGTRRLPPVSSGQRQHTCDLCGKGYEQKAALARHAKDCGKRNTDRCLYCGAVCDTFAAVRQHERRHHPEEYKAALLSRARPPDSVLMEKIANVESKSRNGVFVTECMAVTGLTKHQIRHLREKEEYAGYLERARATQKAVSKNLFGAGPSTSARRPSTPTPSMASTSSQPPVKRPSTSPRRMAPAPPSSPAPLTTATTSSADVPRRGPASSEPPSAAPPLAGEVQETHVHLPVAPAAT